MGMSSSLQGDLKKLMFPPCPRVPATRTLASTLNFTFYIYFYQKKMYVKYRNNNPPGISGIRVTVLVIPHTTERVNTLTSER